jgi:hypothetical protein
MTSAQEYREMAETCHLESLALFNDGCPDASAHMLNVAAALREAAEMREVLEQMRTFIRDGWDGAVRLQSSSIAADIYADSLFRRVDALLESDR